MNAMKHKIVVSFQTEQKLRKLPLMMQLQVSRNIRSGKMKKSAA